MYSSQLIEGYKFESNAFDIVLLLYYNNNIIILIL